MSREKGNLAEKKAIEFLKNNDFEIIDINFYSRYGEIDIIARKEDILHFIEVKSSTSYENAISNITPSKLQKIIKTSQIYMKKNNYYDNYIFDAVIITSNEIELIENITI